jgi:hypothetical protein
LKNHEISIRDSVRPKRPALAAREKSRAKTIRTPAAPPRVGRRRWARIVAFRIMGFSPDLKTARKRRK